MHQFLSEIIFEDQDQNSEVTLKEGDELILKMNAAKLPLKQCARLGFHTYSIKEDVVMHTFADGWASKYGVKMMGHKDKRTNVSWGTIGSAMNLLNSV